MRPTTEALIATVAMGIFSSAFGLMLFYMCLTRLGTLTTNAQGYLRIPIGVGLSVVLLGEAVPSNLALGLVLVMAGVAAMTIPAAQYRNWLQPLARARTERSHDMRRARLRIIYRSRSAATKANMRTVIGELEQQLRARTSFALMQQEKEQS